MLNLKEKEVLMVKEIFDTTDQMAVLVNGQKVKRGEFWSQYFKIDEINDRGALNLALGVIESVFVDRRTKLTDKIGVSREVDRAFLDSNFAKATYDLSDGAEVSKVLKKFDEIKPAKEIYCSYCPRVSVVRNEVIELIKENKLLVICCKCHKEKVKEAEEKLREAEENGLEIDETTELFLSKNKFHIM